MFDWKLGRRKLVTLGTLAFLAGCKAIPSAPPSEAPPPVAPPPVTSNLPTDTQRHRVALLVPLSGPNAGVGQSVANAAAMALLDANAKDLRITNYDTAAGADAAARRALADGNKLFLGPLLSEDIATIAAIARPAQVPLISFSNDQKAASSDVFIMGNLPSQSVARTVEFARSRGVAKFAGLVPEGEYGQRASAALTSAAKANRGSVVALETYDRGNTSIAGAATRLKERGGYEAVLIADGGRLSAQGAPLLKPANGAVQIIGTELWSGEKVVMDSAALRGAWFSAVSDQRFGQFAKSYKTRFGAQPFRIATLGYDAVLLTLRITRDWTPGKTFPTAKLADKGGFLGLDGPFRFSKNGVVERALEVREIQAGSTITVSPAPTRFED